MVMDSSEFNARFKSLMEIKMPIRMKKGLALAGAALMEDTIMDLPSTPLLTSALRSSGAVFVDMHKVADSSRHRFMGAADFQAYTAEIANKGMVADIVFNAPYAARWHENMPKSGSFSHPGAGMKYMERKLVGNAEKYIGIIVAEVKV